MLEDDVDEAGDGNLYHHMCFIQHEKMRKKDKIEKDETEDFKSWLKEFRKTTSRINEEDHPPTVATNTAIGQNGVDNLHTTLVDSITQLRVDLPISQSVRVDTSMKHDINVSPSTRVDHNKSSRPEPNITELMKALGPPPSPKENPEAYKAYMRRKYELQALENQEVLRNKKSAF